MTLLLPLSLPLPLPLWCAGSTGSGKTHTMMGNEQVGAGLMVLSVRELFT